MTLKALKDMQMAGGGMDEISVVNAQIFKLASPLTQVAVEEHTPKSKPKPAASVDLLLLLLAVPNDTRFTDLHSAFRRAVLSALALFGRRGTGSLRS